MYKLEKSAGKLIVRYRNPAMQTVAILSTVATLALFIQSFSDPAALKGALICILFILVPLVMMRSATYVFDMSSRKMNYQIRGPLFRRRFGEISYDEINAVELESYRDSEGEGFRVVLKCREQTLPLNETYEDKRQLLECFKQVHEAVLQRLPDMESINPKLTSNNSASAGKSSGGLIKLSDSMDEKARDLIRQKKMIDAIKLVRTETGCDLKEAKDFVDQMAKNL